MFPEPFYNEFHIDTDNLTNSKLAYTYFLANMATYKQLSFIKKYQVIIIAMAILPNHIMGFPTSANDNSMMAFRVGNNAKNGESRGT